MNLLQRLFGAVRHRATGAAPAGSDQTTAVGKEDDSVADFPGRRHCPVCSADARSIGIVNESGEVGRPTRGAVGAATIFSCGECGSRWTAPAIAPAWQPRIRMTVVARDPKAPNAGPPERVCEVLSDGVDGLLKVERPVHKDALGKVLGMPRQRLVAGGRSEDGTCFDIGRAFGAWEIDNLRNIAICDLRFSRYCVDQFTCDGIEDAAFRDAGIQERAATRKLLEDALGDETLTPPPSSGGR